MHDKGALFPKRKDFFDASAGVERFLLVAERYGAATVLWLGAGERFVPSEFQARCVDDELRNAVFYKIIHGVLDKRFLEDRHEGFREDETQGSQASAETGSEDECLHGEKNSYQRCGRLKETAQMPMAAFATACMVIAGVMRLVLITKMYVSEPYIKAPAQSAGA